MSNKSSSKELLGDLLVARDREVNGKRAADPMALHEAFVGVAGLETVGDACYGYGASGSSGGISVGLDIGMMVLPGMLTCEASLGVSALRAHQSFVCLVRQPLLKSVPRSQRAPFMLMNAAGLYFAGKLRVGGGFGVQGRVGMNAAGGVTNMMSERERVRRLASGGEDTRTLQEKVALDVGLGLGCSASGSYEGEYAMVYDPSPAWYPSVRDPRLVTAFASITHVGSKARTKIHVEQFFKDAEHLEITRCFHGFTFWQSIRSSILSGHIPTKQLWASLNEASLLLSTLWTLKNNRARDVDDIGGFLAELAVVMQKKHRVNHASKQQHKTLSAEFERAQNALKKKLSDYFMRPGLKSLWPEESWYRTTPTLEQWKAGLENVSEMIDRLTPEHYLWLTTQCSAHMKALALHQLSKNEVKQEGLRVKQEHPVQYLSHLCMWGHKGESGVEVQAKADLGFLASVGAKADYQRIWKSTQYRFQHYRPIADTFLAGLTQNEVFTQDASLYYTQSFSHAEVRAHVVATGSQAEKKRGHGQKLSGRESDALVNKQWGDAASESGIEAPVFNAMSYKIGHAVWLCPAAWGTHGERTTLRKGSGLTYGQSVTIRGLQLALAHAKAAGGKAEDIPEDSILQTYAECIHVRPAKLAEALLAMDWLIEDGVGAPDPLNPGKNIELKSFLLEGVFSAGEGLQVPIHWKHGKREPKLDPQFRDQLETSSMALQSIRLRYRKADMLNWDTPFKLGAPIGFIKVGIELNSVQRAGAAGMVTLATHFFGDFASLNDAPVSGSSTWSAPETIVPEAVVFHQ